jgi:hypothetical protein
MARYLGHVAEAVECDFADTLPPAFDFELPQAMLPTRADIGLAVPSGAPVHTLPVRAGNAEVRSGLLP